MIELTGGVAFRYPGAATAAVDEVNLVFREGELTAVVGPNGSGKSTLAKLLNGILVPAGGSVRVDGLCTATDDVYAIRARVGLVFQSPDNQIVASVVERDCAFALENLGMPRDEMRQRVAWALEVTDLSEKREALTHHLSGGQKQRLAIAGIIAMKPRYVVLDEPFAMLDPRGRQEVFQTLINLRSEGITVIVVTQFMETAMAAERLIAMQNGKIAWDGPPDEFFADWNRAHDLGLEVPLVRRMAERGAEALGVELPKLDLPSLLEASKKGFGG